MRRGNKEQTKPAPGAFRQALDGAIPEATARSLDGVARETLADRASFTMGAHLWNAIQHAYSRAAQNGFNGHTGSEEGELAAMPSELLDLLP